MKYTRAQRHRIYKDALPILKIQRMDHGICFSIKEAGHEYPWDLKILYPEIWKQKPKSAGAGAWWFPDRESSRKRRLAILRKAIRQTAPKKIKK